MTRNQFIKTLSNVSGVTFADIGWLLDCGEINASYGYDKSELSESNLCAQEIISKLGGVGQSVVNICATIGWWICAEGWSNATQSKATQLLVSFKLNN